MSKGSRDQRWVDKVRQYGWDSDPGQVAKQSQSSQVAEPRGAMRSGRFRWADRARQKNWTWRVVFDLLTWMVWAPCREPQSALVLKIMREMRRDLSCVSAYVAYVAGVSFAYVAYVAGVSFAYVAYVA
ncbi:MAG: hypothetical protein D9C04_03510 [Nitrosopumilus sp. B06]|nr:MAG: hypothetical protein D9C04_03510 [Nitrosopumilus sp. B06]